MEPIPNESVCIPAAVMMAFVIQEGGYRGVVHWAVMERSRPGEPAPLNLADLARRTGLHRSKLSEARAQLVKARMIIEHPGGLFEPSFTPELWITETPTGRPWRGGYTRSRAASASPLNGKATYCDVSPLDGKASPFAGKSSPFEPGSSPFDGVVQESASPFALGVSPLDGKASPFDDVFPACAPAPAPDMSRACAPAPAPPRIEFLNSSSEGIAPNFLVSPVSDFRGPRRPDRHGGALHAHAGTHARGADPNLDVAPPDEVEGPPRRPLDGDSGKSIADTSSKPKSAWGRDRGPKPPDIPPFPGDMACSPKTDEGPHDIPDDAARRIHARIWEFTASRPLCWEWYRGRRALPAETWERALEVAIDRGIEFRRAEYLVRIARDLPTEGSEWSAVASARPSRSNRTSQPRPALYEPPMPPADPVDEEYRKRHAARFAPSPEEQAERDAEAQRVGQEMHRRFQAGESLLAVFSGAVKGVS